MSRSSKQCIKRSRLSGALLRLLGFRHNAVAMMDGRLHLLGDGSPKKIPLASLTGPVVCKRWLWFTTILLPAKDGGNDSATGFKRSEAKKFVSTANSAWKANIIGKFTALEPELSAIAEIVLRLKQPKGFPSACLVEPYLDRAKRVLEQLPKRVPSGVLPADLKEKFNLVVQFRQEATEMRQSAIDAFMKTELAEMNGFFESIESNPLTAEQRNAVITDEDATLIPAGAGSGKTSVIVAKAAYLIKRNIRKPNEILLMTFTNNASMEMAERVKNRVGVSVDSMTFHALGNRIIQQVEGQKPQLAPHASDDSQYINLVRGIVYDIAKESKFAALLNKWFSEFYFTGKSEWDFKSKAEYEKYVKAHEPRTLRGELVKSQEELSIANWLYLNGIAYEYEARYGHGLETLYRPDFRLTRSGIYIEHFGIRKSDRSKDGYSTASFVDHQKYMDGINWKREVHKEHGTALVQTFSYEQIEGKLLENLESKLAVHGVKPKPISANQIFRMLKARGVRNAFTQNLGVFLRHFKSTRNTIEQCLDRAKKSNMRARAIAFIKIFELLYKAYQAKLAEDNQIDFEDMIILATKYVESGQYISPYRHLIVDEFQDISQASGNLLKALKAQHRDARIFAVGDDWQSIYRFSGADIHLMADFGAEFGGSFAGKSGIHRRVDLTHTFRSVDKIALPARAFVLQNPSQIEKDVNPAGKADAPAIRVAYYEKGQEEQVLNAILDEIKGPKAKVFLLGRYKRLKPEKPLRHSRHVIQFMTVHKSKGLEADHVVILGANSEEMGFPCEIVDEPLLNLVLPKEENYEFAEERRLFYVALTRARKSVTILAEDGKPSAFVHELVNNSIYKAIEI